MKIIGSQRRETLQEAGYKFVNRVACHSVILENEFGREELWVENDHHAGYVVEVDGKGHEFAREYPMIQVGTYVWPDNWAMGNCLRKGLEGFCPFYLPTNNPIITQLACNVEITGRRPQRRCGDYYLRVRITFIGDGEPDTVCGGWIPCN